MTDSVFRTKQVQTDEKSLTQPMTEKNQAKPVINVEPPYLDYTKVHSHPYLVDHLQLGDRWEEGFSSEVGLVESYLQSKIESGDLPNSLTAVKNEVKRLEKINNISKEERPVMKAGILSAYVKFLMEADKVKYNVRKYR
jgi:hypothetical protein